MWLNKQLIAGVLGLACAHSALACGYHGAIGDHLSVMHPDSLVVAVAMRRAAEAGTLDFSDLEAAVRRPGMYLSVVRRLHHLRGPIASATANGDSELTFSVGLVESGLWTRYQASDGKVAVDIHSDGPRDGEAVLLTAEPVLRSIQSGSLTVEQALVEKLAVIEGQAYESATIRRVLEGASAQASVDRSQSNAKITSIAEAFNSTNEDAIR